MFGMQVHRESIRTIILTDAQRNPGWEVSSYYPLNIRNTGSGGEESGCCSEKNRPGGCKGGGDAFFFATLARHRRTRDFALIELR